jgi:acyl-CoA reductase-like NAD-dependent aldehyde dehydrogenase
VGTHGFKNIVSYHPVGVAAGIVPWNYPVDLYCWKVGPALAAGCPIIIKPPHETPFAIAKVVECFHEAGIPAGALANLPGTGPEVGAALSAHPGIAMISATASINAGQDIARNAAGNLKRLSLELGGQSPFMVLPDADIEAAASAALRRSFSNMGQICISVNRILVHREVHKRFLDALAAQTEAIVLGHGLTPGIAYGPVLNQSVLARVEMHLADALKKGGKLVAGGHAPVIKGLERGHFFRPTLIDDAPLNSLPMTAETFGPLAAVRAFDTLDEMIWMANSLQFGLAAYIYTEDLELGWDIADKLEFGTIGLNVNDTSELQAPFGGWKMSGFGRELGREGLEAYLETKSLKLRVRGR